MTDFATEYQHLSDDELLQVWVERPQLVAEAESALRDEIRKRGLAREAEHAVNVWAKPPEQQLAPPVETFINLSVLWFAIRELWLRLQTRSGVPVEAHVEATRRTKPSYRSGARAELRYSYKYQGKKTKDGRFAISWSTVQQQRPSPLATMPVRTSWYASTLTTPVGRISGPALDGLNPSCSGLSDCVSRRS